MDVEFTTKTEKYIWKKTKCIGCNGAFELSSSVCKWVMFCPFYYIIVYYIIKVFIIY